MLKVRDYVENSQKKFQVILVTYQNLQFPVPLSAALDRLPSLLSLSSTLLNLRSIVQIPRYLIVRSFLGSSSDQKFRIFIGLQWSRWISSGSRKRTYRYQKVSSFCLWIRPFSRGICGFSMRFFVLGNFKFMRI